MNNEREGRTLSDDDHKEQETRPNKLENENEKRKQK